MTFSRVNDQTLCDVCEGTKFNCKCNTFVPAQDMVNSPKHYLLGNGVEVLDVIESRLGREGFISYCEGNVIKYALRARFKGKYEEDMAKAEFYLKKMLALMGDKKPSEAVIRLLND